MNNLPEGCESASELLDGFGSEHIAQVFGVSTETASRWKRKKDIPPMAQRLANVLLHQHLGGIDKAFNRWIFRRGELVSPGGDCFTPGRILSSIIARQLNDDYRLSVAKKTERIQELEAELAVLRSELAAREAQIQRMLTSGPVRVQLVAVDAEGNSVPLCAPVTPIMRIAMEMPSPAGNGAYQAA
jgi:hypothetical protein